MTASDGEPAALRNGIDRSLDGEDNGWFAKKGDSLEYRFAESTQIMQARIVFDSDLNRLIRTKKLDPKQVHGNNDPAAIASREMRCCYRLNQERKTIPECMTRSFRLEAEGENGQWQVIFHEQNNYQRLIKIPLDIKTIAVRLILEGEIEEKGVYIPTAPDIYEPVLAELKNVGIKLEERREPAGNQFGLAAKDFVAFRKNYTHDQV